MPASDKPEERDIIVVGKVKDDKRAVWDRHPYHPSNYGSPEGEIFISDMRPYDVHRSRGIQQKIGEKELRELGDRAAQQRRQEFEEQDKIRQQQRDEALATSSGAAVTVPTGVVPPADNEALPGSGSSGVMIPASEQHDAEDDEEDEEKDGGSRSGGQRVRRPRQSGGSTPER